MSAYCIYVELEPYLAQWFIHEQGGVTPVNLVRGSVESKIMFTFLTKPPKDYYSEEHSDWAVAINIPTFKQFDVRTYNHLPKHAIVALRKCISNRFVLALWNDLHDFGHIGKEQQELIYAWMENHGIEMNETNWNTIAKIYQRKRRVYLNRKNRKNRSDLGDKK